MSLREREKVNIVPRKRGRPSGFTAAHCEQAFRLALLGATDEEMADFWGITTQTLNVWKKSAPGFLAALMRGKLDADANVANKLYQRAIGYSHKAVKIFNDQGTPLIVPYTEHYPPDTNAATTWLALRQRGRWSPPKQEPLTVNLNVALQGASEEDLRAKLAELTQRALARTVTDVVDEVGEGETDDGDEHR
jgi:hypothetical protein